MKKPEKIKPSKKIAPKSIDPTLKRIANHIQDLAQKGVAAYTPLVEGIVNTKSKDTSHIEWALDHLLDFCFDSKALVLFNRLCKYYRSINPVAADSYTKAYQEMWGDEPEIKR